MRKLSKYLCILFLTSCGNNSHSEPAPASTPQLQYFGFTLIDTAWDDPSDGDGKTNYADEVYSFSNLADLLVLQPSDSLSRRVERFNQLGMKAVLHLNELFFEFSNTNSPSGANYNLRSDFERRWTIFKNTNRAILKADLTAALYIGEEPTWNGINFRELRSVANLIKGDFPEIPIMIVEAYPALNRLKVPKNVDWIGFSHYFIKNPATHPDYRRGWRLLKSKRSHPGQRIIMIMDSHYIPGIHNSLGNIGINEMDEVALSYFELAKSDELVIGILGYFWPNGFDRPESIGARGMPHHVLETYKRIGKEICTEFNRPSGTVPKPRSAGP